MGLSLPPALGLLIPEGTGGEHAARAVLDRAICPPAAACVRVRAAEIIMFDDVVVVYKFIGDLCFYVTGHQDENEARAGSAYSRQEFDTPFEFRADGREAEGCGVLGESSAVGPYGGRGRDSAVQRMWAVGRAAGMQGGWCMPGAQATRRTGTDAAAGLRIRTGGDGGRLGRAGGGGRLKGGKTVMIGIPQGRVQDSTVTERWPPNYPTSTVRSNVCVWLVSTSRRTNLRQW